MSKTDSSNEDQPTRSEVLIEELCKAAHHCWMAQAERDGWQPGKSYDEGVQSHDALVPFEQLHRRDRRSLRIAVIAEELERHLMGMVDYERGPDRVFLIEEMSIGLRVGLSRADEPSRYENTLGTVVDWETDSATGELESIKVRWDDGDVTDHHPDVRELRRLD